jgi:hypothetical protein
MRLLSCIVESASVALLFRLLFEISRYSLGLFLVSLRLLARLCCFYGIFVASLVSVYSSSLSSYSSVGLSASLTYFLAYFLAVFSYSFSSMFSRGMPVSLDICSRIWFFCTIISSTVSFSMFLKCCLGTFRVSRNSSI